MHSPGSLCLSGIRTRAHDHERAPLTSAPSLDVDAMTVVRAAGSGREFLSRTALLPCRRSAAGSTREHRVTTA